MFLLKIKRVYVKCWGLGLLQIWENTWDSPLSIPLPHKIMGSSFKNYKASWQVGKPTCSLLRVDWCLPNQSLPLSQTTTCNVQLSPLKFCKMWIELVAIFCGGSSDSKRKLHMVGWKKITKPKKEGDLGLQSAKEKNLTLLAKLNWRLHNKKDAIWARVISQKYGSFRRTRSFRTRPRLCSVT